MASITVEVPQEYIIQEIAFDGTEMRQNPPSMSESLAKLAHKIDFSQLRSFDRSGHKEVDRDRDKKAEKEDLVFPQPPQWQWESVRTKLRNALAEASVLLDVMNISREKKYLVLDPVAQDPPPRRPVVCMFAKKKAMGNAAEILLRGVDKLKLCQTEISRNRGIPNFHLELLRLRQNWRLKKVGGTIIGDLSYASSGSRFRQSGIFEVSKTSEADPMPNGGFGHQQKMPALKVTLPPELDWECYIEVVVQKDIETLLLARLRIPPHLARSMQHGGIAGLIRVPRSADIPWERKLENAQNTLFCKELFSQLAREAVFLPTNIPHMIVGNEITVNLFPMIQLIVALRQVPLKNSQLTSLTGATSGRKQDHNLVLEHTLHQLLWSAHYKHKNQSMPHPSTGPIGFTSKRRNAGPSATSRQALLGATRMDSLLEQIIRQSRHLVLRLRTMYIIDTLTKEIKDPLIVAHWNALNAPAQTQVKINITSCGYEALSRTSLVITVRDMSLKTVCRDGRVMNLSIDPQELRDLLLCQVAQHQITAVQTLAKCHGWQTVSSSTFLGGVGPMEPLGNPSSCVLSSPRGGYKLLAVKCTPQRGFRVSIASVVAKKNALMAFDANAYSSSDNDGVESDGGVDFNEVSKLEFNFGNDEPMMDFDDLTRDLNFGAAPAAKRALLFDSGEKSRKKRRKFMKDESGEQWGPDETQSSTIYFKDLRHGPLKEVALERIEGRNYLNKIELIMACLASSPYTDLH